VAGLNTLLVSASATPVPDIVATTASLTNDGVVVVVTDRQHAFGVDRPDRRGP
jgi:hypothetical protein